MATEKFEDRKLFGKIRIKLSRTDHSCGPFWEVDKREIVRNIDSIIERYYHQSRYKLTLRQLYYQLVAADYIPNDDKVYSKLSAILDDCRYGGKVDWNSIEDRGRVPDTPYYEHSIPDAIQRTLYSYQLDKRRGQEKYCELWTEKDAISGILKKAVKKYTMTVCVNKGFTSSTAIHIAYERFVEKIIEKQKVIVLYFGDHDPSGLDMIRDIRERLEFMMINGDHKQEMIEAFEEEELDELARESRFNHEFNAASAEEDHVFRRQWFQEIFVKCIVDEYFEVKQIGLTMEQIKKFNLPPNPAKLTDPRAAGYIAKYGEISWEVDALQPTDLIKIIEDSLVDVIDRDKLQEILDLEEKEKEQLKKLIENLS